jgi:hypothetical protein
MAAKRKRVVLSLETKADILKRIENGEGEAKLAAEHGEH